MSLPNPRVSVCIPARFGSSRFPGKPLVLVGGKPLIQHVYEAVQSTEGVGEIVVLTDHQDIFRTVRNFGCQALMVKEACRTGTDRVAKVADQLQYDVVVNLQADEIPQHPGLLQDLILPFLHTTDGMGTLKRSIRDAAELNNASIVKVVTDQKGQALYFSRSAIPYWRDGKQDSHTPFAWMHLGIYIFRKPTLLALSRLPTGVLEEAEKLEQLRALEYGIPIRVWETRHASLRIDNPEDVSIAEVQLASSHSSGHSPPHS